MANKTITDLTLIGSLTDSANLPVDNGIQTYRATMPQVAEYVRPYAHKFRSPTITANGTTITASMITIPLDPTSANFTQDLPAVASITTGTVFEFVNIATIASDKKVTIDASGAELIGDNQTLVLYPQQSCLLYNNGTKWIILSHLVLDSSIRKAHLYSDARDVVSSSKTNSDNNTTVSYSDDVLLVDTSTAFAMTMFASSLGSKPIKIKKVSNDLNLFTLNRDGSDTFRDKATGSLTSVALKYPGEEMVVVKTATNVFEIIDRKYDQPQFGFGFTHTQGTGIAMAAADLHAWRFECPRNMVMTEISMLIPSRTAGQKIVMGIYADNGNTPVGGAKLAQTSEYTTVATDNGPYFLPLTTPVKLTKGTRYWLSYHCDSAGTVEQAFNHAAGTGQKYRSIAYSSTMPSTFPSLTGDAGGTMPIAAWGV